MIKFTLENQEYNIQDDAVIKDNSHEELYSYIITKPNSDKLDIETMDYATIEEDGGFRASMVVNAINEDTTSFNPMKYRYTLSFLSEAIKLQKIICPNLKITQRQVKDKITIYEKIEQYFNVYVKPQYPELSLSNELKELLGDTICPEKMWNRPTMFEVFNELLMVKNAQIDIRFHEITYKEVKMDDIGNEIDTSNLSLLNHTQNINEYANRLDVEMNNGISNKATTTIQGLSQRSASGAVLTEDNAQFILDKPIDEIYNVRLFIPNTITDFPEFYEIDITKYVVEMSVYQTYYSSSAPTLSLATSDRIDYKRLALYYAQGSNTIDGLSFDENQIISTSFSAIRTIAYRVLYQMYGENTADALIRWSIANAEGNDPRKWMYVVNYRPIDTFRFNVVKTSKHNATLVDNQSDSYVDAQDFINAEQEKLNRLGNKTMIISGRFNSYNEIPKLSDYIDDYVLAEREIVLHDHFVLFKGYLYKDYIRKNVYYGINSRKRNSVILTGNNALTRNDIIEKQYEFSTTDAYNDQNQTQRYLLSGINSYGRENVYIQPSMSNALITTFDKNGKDIISADNTDIMLIGNKRIVKKMTNYVENRINLAHFSMVDNYSAGMMIGSTSAIGGFAQKYAKYVDENGEFEKIAIEIRTSESSYITGDAAGNNYRFSVSNNLPLMRESDIESMFSPKYSIGTFEKTLYKDNGEITAITIQFTFLDSDEVIIGSFGKYTPVNLFNKGIDDLVIYYSNDEIYEIGDMTCKGNKSSAIIDTSAQESWEDGENITPNYIKLLNIDELSNCKSWAIGRNDGEMLLGINCVNGFKDTIYMNEKQ